MVALYTQHTYNLWYWSGNIETKVSLHYITEFVSLLDPNMKKVLICPEFENRRRFQNLSKLITPVSCLVISVVDQLIQLKWCSDIFCAKHLTFKRVIMLIYFVSWVIMLLCWFICASKWHRGVSTGNILVLC